MVVQTLLAPQILLSWPRCAISVIPDKSSQHLADLVKGVFT